MVPNEGLFLNYELSLHTSSICLDQTSFHWPSPSPVQGVVGKREIQWSVISIPDQPTESQTTDLNAEVTNVKSKTANSYSTPSGCSSKVFRVYSPITSCAFEIYQTSSHILHVTWIPLLDVSTQRMEYLWYKQQDKVCDLPEEKFTSRTSRLLFIYTESSFS